MALSRDTATTGRRDQAEGSHSRRHLNEMLRLQPFTLVLLLGHKIQQLFSIALSPPWCSATESKEQCRSWVWTAVSENVSQNKPFYISWLSAMLYPGKQKVAQQLLLFFPHSFQINISDSYLMIVMRWLTNIPNV